MNGSNASGYSYADYHRYTDGGWFGSSKDEYWTEYRALDAQTNKLFTDVFKSLSSTLVSLSEALGTDVNAALNYSFGSVKINLQGMNAENISKTINSYFSSLGDTAVSALFSATVYPYQQIGEGIMETAVRLVTDKVIILDTLEMTGNAFTGTASEAIALSESLIALAGDLETLRDAAETYYDKFYSDAEKQARLQGQLSGALADMNMSLPTARAGYRQLVESLDLTTQSGQSAYVTLLKMSEYADEYYSAVEDATGSTSDLTDELKSLAKTIDEWLASLRTSDLSPVLSEASFQAEYTKMLTAANATGSAPEDVSDFLSYATKFLTYEKSYGTSASYQAIYDAVVGDVMMLKSKNDLALGSYAIGTDYVPETGLYELHEGEAVIPTIYNKPNRTKELGAAIGEYIMNSNGGSAGGDIHVSIQIDGREIGNVVAKQIKTNSDLQTSIRRLN